MSWYNPKDIVEHSKSWSPYLMGLGTGYAYKKGMFKGKEIPGQSPEQQAARESLWGELQGQLPSQMFQQYYQPWAEESKKWANVAGRPIEWGKASQQAMDVFKPYLTDLLTKQLGQTRERYGTQGLGFGTDVMRAETGAQQEMVNRLGAESMPFAMKMAMQPQEQAMQMAALYQLLGKEGMQAYLSGYDPWQRFMGDYKPSQYAPSEMEKLLGAGGDTASIMAMLKIAGVI